MHGGKSTGPKTATGRKRCAAAKTAHGRETRPLRKERSEGLRRLAEMEYQARQMGMISGPVRSGRKPGISKAKYG